MTCIWFKEIVILRPQLTSVIDVCFYLLWQTKGQKVTILSLTIFIENSSVNFISQVIIRSCFNRIKRWKIVNHSDHSLTSCPRHAFGTYIYFLSTTGVVITSKKARMGDGAQIHQNMILLVFSYCRTIFCSLFWVPL